MVYRADCTKCGAEVFRFDRLGDVEIQLVLEHLWTAHPDVLERPSTMSLGDLLTLVHVRMA